MVKVYVPTLLEHVFQLANTYQVQTIVDPKGADWSKYDGATCITPNVKELGESLGRVIPNDDASVIEAAKEVLNKVNIKYIIGTSSAWGLPLANEMVELGITQPHNQRCI